MMKLLLFVVLLANVPKPVKAGSDGYPYTVEKRWDLVGRYDITGTAFPSWDTNYDGTFHREEMWVRFEDKIHFFDITDFSKDHMSSTPQVIRTLDTNSDCLESFTMGFGGKLWSLHGETPACGCVRTEENPCPHKFEVIDPNGSSDLEGKYDFGGNQALPVSSIVPDVQGEYAVADPLDACDPIVNPSAISGKYCVVMRGTCYFQTKFEMCHAAGAIGTVIVNVDDQLINMLIDEAHVPVIIIPSSLGDALIAAEGTGLQFKMGKGTGSDEPDPAYAEPDPLSVINYYTGERYDDFTVDFTTILSLTFDARTEYMYFDGTDGSTKTEVYDWKAKPEKVGEFNFNKVGFSNILYGAGASTYLIYTDYFDCGCVELYDITGDKADNPQKIATIPYEPCGDYDGFGDVWLHPNNRYLYMHGDLHWGDCEDFTFQIWDLEVPSDPKQVGTFDVPEVEVYAQINCFSWSPDNIAAFCHASGGFTWYDFTDPLFPVAVAHVDVNGYENTYTVGASSVRYGRDGTWVLGESGETYYDFHGVSVKPDDVECPSMPDLQCGTVNCPALPEFPPCPDCTCGACPACTNTCDWGSSQNNADAYNTTDKDVECDNTVTIILACILGMTVILMMGCFYISSQQARYIGFDNEKRSPTNNGL